MRVATGVGAAGAAVFLLGAVMGWYGFPHLISSQIAKSVALMEGSDIRKMWAKFPDPIDFKVYLFNVTNPMEVQKGAKPVLSEIGPFFYDQYKEKINLKDNEEDDTVSYNQKITWYFNPKKSEGLTGDEIVTIPHAMILGMVLILEKDKPAMLGMINKAIPHVFGNPTSVFATAPARDFLFEGVTVNCSQKDFSAKAVCTGIKKNGGKDLNYISSDVFKFSFFGHKNGTPETNEFRVKRGSRNSSELGMMVTYNGKEKLSVWSGDECNKIRGTDSTIFPPFLNDKDPIVAFAADLCRSLDSTFVTKEVFNGIPGQRYAASLGDMSTNPSERCYCPTPDTCLKKGALDLTPCQGTPVVATLPHFYDTSEDYQRTVIGLNPTEEQHGITMVFEPMTGTPIMARKRLQFNIFIHPVEKVDLMSDIADALLPIFWVEEGLELDEKYLSELRGLMKVLGIMGAVKWVMMALGVGVGAAAGYLRYRKKDTLVVTPKQMTPPHKTPGLPPLEVSEVNGSPRY